MLPYYKVLVLISVWAFPLLILYVHILYKILLGNSTEISAGYPGHYEMHFFHFPFCLSDQWIGVGLKNSFPKSMKR